MISDYMRQRQALAMGVKTIPEPELKDKSIAGKSEKRIKEDKEYKRIVKELMAKSKKCEVCSPVCTQVAQGLHHKQKRSPKNLLNKENLMRACNPCNLWIEENPVESEKLGLTISRFKK